MREQFYSTKIRTEHFRAVLSTLIGSALIALGPFCVEFSSASAITNTFYRLVIGAIFFMVYSLLKKELKFDPKFLLVCILVASFLVLDLYLCNQSVLYLGAGLATILSNIEVIFLVLIGKLLFSEKTPNHFVFQCIFIVIGIAALLLPVLPTLNTQSFLGITLALGASLIYAFYLFSIKQASKIFPAQTPNGILAISCLTGAFLLGIVIAFGNPHLFCMPNWKSGGCILVNSVLSQIFGWWFISRGIVKLSLSLSGLLMLLQPALTFSLDCIFLARNTLWFQLLGSLCLLGAVFLASQSQQSQNTTT